MLPFRDKVPQRRTINTVVAKWSQHKPDLKIDFNDCCAYCDSYDGFRHTWYEVDHFIPKNFFGPLGNISLTQYSNLVYSCKFCNNNKLNKWPSKSETIFNVNHEGFIDPCDANYDNHFHRNPNGAIMWSTDLGKWMHTKAFKFDERERGIRLLWNLKKLRNTIKALDPVVKQLKISGSNSYSASNAKLHEYAYEFFKFHDELIEYYNSL